MERLGNFIYRRAKLIIAVVIVLNIVAAVSFINFSLDTDFLSFFSGGNPKAVEYNELNAKYESGETVSVFIEHDSPLLGMDTLQEVYRVQHEIENIEGVSQVQSFVPPEILIDGQIVSIDEQFIEENYTFLRDFIENQYFFAEQFLAPDGLNGVLIVTIDLDARASDVVKSLKEIVQNEDELTLSLAGNEIVKDTIWGYLIRVFILMPFGILLILSVFYLVLRVRRFTILAFIPAGIAALWIFGTIFWSGRGLNLVTVISPMFILTVGSAFGLHYVSHFAENLQKFSDRRLLTIETLRMVGTPIFLAAITTMAGFVSLTWTDVLPMRDMGIFVTVGIGYAGLLALFFVPAVLSRAKLPAKLPEIKPSFMTRLVLAASRHRSAIVIVFTALVVVSAIYIPKLEVVSDQLMFFKEGSEVRKNFAKVEEYFGGAIPLTAEIIAPKGLADLNDYEFANRVLATERELEELPGIRNAFSILDLAKGINKIATGEDAYPQNPIIIQAMLMQIEPDTINTFVSNDGMRMTVRTQDFDSRYIDDLEAFVREHSDTIRVITGMPLLFDEMNRLVVASQIKSLGLALALIFLMLLITLRKIKAALVGMLPIGIAIISILGMLAITDFNLNIMTANLSAICIGVGVDYAIHLLSGIYYFRRNGMDDRQSVDAAITSVSRPVLANAFGLAIGLSVLFFSPVRLHFHAASIMWIAMIVSSMAALLLIPIFYTRGKKVVEK